MEPIEFKNRENPDYEAQLTYLIKREFLITYNRYRKLPFYLIGASIFVLGIFLLTPSNNLITLKVMLFVFLPLTWIVAILFTFPIFLKLLNRYKWKKKLIALPKNETIGYKLYFDHEIISFKTPTYKTEFSWDYYTYWIENKNSIYIFPQSNLYEALYYSESDLGIEIYLEFKSIAATKLIKLDD